MIELTVRSPVLTNEEAVRFLRLDHDYPEPADAVKALHRLVQQGKLRPLQCGKTYKFTLAERERFIAAEAGPSDRVSNSARAGLSAGEHARGMATGTRARRYLCIAGEP